MANNIDIIIGIIMKYLNILLKSNIIIPSAKCLPTEAAISRGITVSTINAEQNITNKTFPLNLSLFITKVNNNIENIKAATKIRINIDKIENGMLYMLFISITSNLK